MIIIVTQFICRNDTFMQKIITTSSLQIKENALLTDVSQVGKPYS